MLKILVVDDEPTVRRGIMLGVDWAQMDCVVVGEASNGLEGLEAVERYHPNLIITDVRMPKMDGIQMLAKLRERGCMARVILLTAYSDFEYVRTALQLDADDYLLKPFRDQELAAAVERVRMKLQQISSRAVESTMPLQKGDKSKYVMEALEYISDHYSDPGISITSISRELGVSEGHLSHIFKKETSDILCAEG